MSSNPVSTFRTLLWAERAPRRKVLRIIAGILAFFASSSVMTYFSLRDIEAFKSHATPFIQGETLVIAGVLYAMFVQGIRGFTVQPPWLTMALPVRTAWLLFPTLFYQTRVAVLLGAVFGIQRFFAGVDHAFVAPIAFLTALSAQGYAACLWWTAEQARGLSVFGIGLASAWLIGIATAALLPVPVLITAAMFLTPCGWASSYLAAQAARGGSVPSIDITRFAPLARFLDWNQDRAASKTEFSSRLWAQVWFEWRRTGWWCACGFLVYTVAKFAVELSTLLATGKSFVGYDDLPTFITLLYLAVPVLVWLAHVAITKPYRRFVFTRPITAKRVAMAKMLTALGVAVAITVFDRAAQGINVIMLPGDTIESAPGPLPAFVDIIVSGARSIGMTLLGLLYGPILFVVMMIPVFFWSLQRTATEVIAGGGPDFVVAFMILPTMLILGVLPLAFAYVGLKSRLDAQAYPKPLEVFLTIALVAIGTALALLEQALGNGDSARNALEYAGPVLLLFSILCYGFRSKQLTMRQAGAVLLAFGISWVVLRANQLAVHSDGPDPWSATQGFWLAVGFSVFVFYPIMIGCQRLETDRTTSAGVPAWAMFLFTPLVGIAFLFLGEDWSEERKRA